MIKKKNILVIIMIITMLFQFGSSFSSAEDASTIRIVYADSCITDADNWQYSYIVGDENGYAASPDIREWLKDINPASICEVSLSSEHFLVLLDNHKVLAYGNNDYGQCDTQDWECTSICADVYCSYGISTDGTILYCGIEDENGVKDWNDIIQLSADYVVIGRNSNGVVFYSNDLTITPPKDIQYIITNGLDIAWIDNQGRVYVTDIDSSTIQALEWTDVKEIAFACHYYLCGLDSKGELLLYLFPNKSTIKEELQGITIEHIFRNGLIDREGNIYLFDHVYTPRLIDTLPAGMQ